MSIVFIRLDKIGDLVATLPVDQALPENLRSSLHWVIPKGLGILAGDHRSYLELDLKDEKNSEKKLCEYLKQVQASMVVVFYAPWWVGRACWQAGVRLRVARRSQWHSYIFYNHGLRQSRTLAEKHEADYNLELMTFAVQKLDANFQPPAQTPVLKIEAKTIRHLFERFAIQPQKYFVVHPGMAGSALNWPSDRYEQLIEKLVAHGPVVITGTNSDEKYLAPLKPRWQKHPQVRWLQAQLNMSELLSLLSNAHTVIAPSTGVLHLAASCGTHCVGIYSPIQVHRAQRWGPRGEHASQLTPQVDCPAEKTCLKEKCQMHPCMPMVMAEQVLERVLNK